MLITQLHFTMSPAMKPGTNQQPDPTRATGRAPHGHPTALKDFHDLIELHAAQLLALLNQQIVRQHDLLHHLGAHRWCQGTTADVVSPWKLATGTLSSP